MSIFYLLFFHLILSSDVWICAFRIQLPGLRPAVVNKTAIDLVSPQSAARVNQDKLHFSQQPRIGARFAVPGNTAQQTDAKTQLSTRPLRIIISGAPASGKGTQCELIATKFGVVHLSTGEILRSAMRQNTPLGQEVRVYMDHNRLVPDDIMIRLVSERLQQPDCSTHGWVLDGYPRTKSQAESLLQSGIKPDCFILLEVPQDILLERATGRRTDPVTGKVYHVRFSPPQHKHIADRLIHRHDDTAEKIITRLKDYQHHTAVVRTYFEDVLVKVNGNASKEEISKSILGTLSRIQTSIAAGVGVK